VALVVVVHGCDIMKMKEADEEQEKVHDGVVRWRRP
jgi:hypothetical protein